MNSKSFVNRLGGLLTFFLLTSTAWAQAEPADDLGKVFHIGVFLFFLFVFIILISVIAYHNREDEELPTFVKVWRKVNGKLTKATPVEKEHTVMLDHEYDGIRELDNVLPPWWKYLFYVTIVFSGIYMLNYHVIDIWPSSTQEYQEEMRIAEVQRAELLASGALINENTVIAVTDAASLADGGDVYKKNCAACHGMKGEGSVGPNLTDEFWIHGGGAKNIFKVVSNGVLDKGMLSWKAQLKPKQIQSLAGYIISLKGTNPPNAKAPQGEKWIEPKADSTAAAAPAK